MNEPDDFDLRHRFSQLFDDEPPMESDATADLERGRRRRRRRLSTVAAASVAVPALMIGGWAVAGSGNPDGSRIDSVQPADPSETTSDGPAQCDVVELGTAVPGRASAEGGQVESEPPSTEAYTCEPLECATAGDDAGAGGTTEGRMPRSYAEGDGEGRGTITWACSDSDDDYTMTDETTARLEAALRRHLGAAAAGHLDQSMSSGSATMSASGELTGAGVGAEWLALSNDGAGFVGVSVAAADDAAPGCLDPNLMSGPDVDCETRTLEDGTTIEVGRGSQDGADRLSVRFERPNGDVVWATADQATAGWWDDQSGPTPLAALPISLDRLIELARDDEMHL